MGGSRVRFMSVGYGYARLNGVAFVAVIDGGAIKLVDYYLY